MTTGKWHHDDPATSKKAGVRVDTGTLRSILYQLLTERPRAAFQLRDYYFRFADGNGWPKVKPDSINKRISDLHKAGLIEESGKTATTEYDREAVIWQVKET